MPRVYEPSTNPRCPCNGKRLTELHKLSKIHVDYLKVSTLITKSFERFCQEK